MKKLLSYYHNILIVTCRQEKSNISGSHGCRRTGRRKGFTLLELLVTIGIIVVLIAMGTVSYTAAQRKGRDSKRRGDMKAIQNALEECYAVNNGSYPTSAWGSGALTCNGQTIMNVYPTDPMGLTHPYAQPGAHGIAYYCHCAQMEVAGTGNSTASNCSSFASSGNYFCVLNLQ